MIGENEEDWWYSEPHTNHVTQTKRESILSEICGVDFNGDTIGHYEEEDTASVEKKGIFESIKSFLF